MPEAGRTPTPQVKQGNSLAYGEADVANRLSAMFPIPDDVEDDEFQPADEGEGWLFGATERPTEPITSGAPFGPGPDVSRWALSEPNDAQLRDRLATQMLTSGSADSKAWAKRRLAGE